jgi:urease accessory protein
VPTTRIAISRSGGRQRLDLVGGLLRPQVVIDRPDYTRIGLVATTALLLGGDQVELEIRVGSYASLELFDVAGTVAYHGRGHPASWRVTILLESGARLDYCAAPFVVSDGAEVLRTLDVGVDPTARVWLRETLVLGRSGQIGGSVRSRTAITVGRRPVLLEDQLLDPSGVRRSPGMLGSHRVIDTILAVGKDAVGTDVSLQPPDPAVRFNLVGGVGSITRYLGTEVAASPLESRTAAGRG